MFVILRHDISDKASEITRAVFFVENLLKFISFSFVNEFEIVIWLIHELSFHLVDPFLLSQNLHQYISFTLRALFTLES